MNLLQVQHQNIYHLGQGAGRLRKEEVQAQFNDVFEHQLGKLEGPVHLEVDPTVSPVKMAVRKFPAALKEELENELERLEGTGVLEKVTIPTDWLSILVTERKNNGKLCLCVDPMPLKTSLQDMLLPTTNCGLHLTRANKG